MGGYRLPLLTIGSYIQWLLDLSLRAPYAASCSITRSIGMILVMMSMAAPGVDSNPPVMRIFSLAAVCCLGFLLYPFHGLGGEPHVGPMVLLHCMIMPLLSYSLVLAHI